MLDVVFAQWLKIGIVACGGILVYAYIIFPVLMVLMGLRQQQRPQRLENSQLPLVTLIIPAHNEAMVIEQKIKNSLEIDYPHLEIIVASDGSTDETIEICRRHEAVNLLAFENQRGKSSVVADAVELSHGKILCLCDANVMFRPDALWRLVFHFSRKDVAGVTGDVRLQSEASSFGLAEALYYRMERSIHRGESNLGAVVGVDGGMYAIRKDLFPRLPADTILDDFATSMHLLRTQSCLLYEPTAIADENATELAMDEYRRRVRIGVGAAQVLRRGWIPRLRQPVRIWLFASHKLVRWLSPWILVSVFIASAALVVDEPILILVLAPGIVVALLALIGTFSPSARKHWGVAVPFYFGLSQVAFAWGMIRGMLFQTNGTWKRTTRRTMIDDTEDVANDSGATR